MKENVYVITSSTFAKVVNRVIQITDETPVVAVYQKVADAKKLCMGIMKDFQQGNPERKIEYYEKCTIYEWAAEVIEEKCPLYRLVITKHPIL